MKKTQLGQGHIRGRDSGELLRGDEEGAARPGDPLRIVLGDCRERKGGQSTESSSQTGAREKLRPVPREPCRRREEPASVQGARRPGCPRGRSERRFNRCEGVLRGEPSESEAQSVRSNPLGGCSESEAQSYAAGPGFGGRESSRFLGAKHWKSQKLRQLSPQQPTGWKGFDGVLGHLDGNHSP